MLFSRGGNQWSLAAITFKRTLTILPFPGRGVVSSLMATAMVDQPYLYLNILHFRHCAAIYISGDVHCLGCSPPTLCGCSSDTKQLSRWLLTSILTLSIIGLIVALGLNTSHFGSTQKMTCGTTEAVKLSCHLHNNLEINQWNLFGP